MASNKNDGTLGGILGFIITVVLGYYTILLLGFAVADFFGWSITILPAIRFLIPDSIFIVEAFLIKLPDAIYEVLKLSLQDLIYYNQTGEKRWEN